MLGTDLGVVEMLQFGEPEHIAVEADPIVELAFLDVADDVIDPQQADGGTETRVGEIVGDVAGFEHVGAVAGAVDERVHRVTERGDLCQFEFAVSVGLEPRLANAACATGHRCRMRRRGIVDEPREIVHTVAVLTDMIGDRRIGRQCATDHEPDVALLEDVAGLGRDPRLRTRIRGATEPERRHQEPGRRAGISHPELDAVPSKESGTGWRGCGR